MPVLGVDPSGSPSASADASAAPASVEPSSEPSVEPSAAPSVAPSPEPSASAEPAERTEEENGGTGKPDKAPKPDKGPKTPEHPVTLTGIVGQPDGEEGEYTLVVGVKVYQLSAGPKWWWGDANPLAGSVGKVVTIDGEQAEGSDEVDVLAIDGTAIRAAGKPPWAGGWKVVGEKHPGWAQWKVDKHARRRPRPRLGPRAAQAGRLTPADVTGKPPELVHLTSNPQDPHLHLQSNRDAPRTGWAHAGHIRAANVDECRVWGLGRSSTFR